SIQLPVLNYSNGETPQEELSKKSLPVEKTPSKITPGYESTQFALGNSLATQGETVAVLDKPGTAKERLSSKPKSIVSEFLSFLGGGKTGKASETSRTPTSVSSKFHSELLGLQGAGGVQEAPVFFGADRTGVSWTLLFWGFFGTLCTLWGLRLNRVSRRRVTGKGTALVVSEKRYRDLN
ncbi:hypothetical protein EBT16_15255, partial [bacterium]|nr:hypothetical protein [bacterium]